MQKTTQKTIEVGKQVKILKCECAGVTPGDYGIIESYLPNLNGYGVNVKGKIVFVLARDIDDDPQLNLNV